MENEKTPAETGEKKGWRLIVDEPTANVVERIGRNEHVAEPFRDILNGLSPLVNCNPALAVELGFDADAEPGKKFTIEGRI